MAQKGVLNEVSPGLGGLLDTTPKGETSVVHGEMYSVEKQEIDNIWDNGNHLETCVMYLKLEF